MKPCDHVWVDVSTFERPRMRMCARPDCGKLEPGEIDEPARAPPLPPDVEPFPDLERPSWLAVAAVVAWAAVAVALLALALL